MIWDLSENMVPIGTPQTQCNLTSPTAREEGQVLPATFVHRGPQNKSDWSMDCWLGNATGNHWLDSPASRWCVCVCHENLYIHHGNSINIHYDILSSYWDKSSAIMWFFSLFADDLSQEDLHFFGDFPLPCLRKPEGTRDHQVPRHPRLHRRNHPRL